MKTDQGVKKLLIRVGIIMMLTILAAGAMATDYGVILLDRSGSMTILRADDNSRFLNAQQRAYMRAIEYANQGYELAVVTFNTPDEGFVIHQPFTSDVALITNTILGLPDAVVGPMTPIADAMCFGTQLLVDADDGGELVLMTLTDGGHNDRHDPPGGVVCTQCEVYDDLWNDDCDPDDQATYPCTDWQDCLVIVWAMNTVHVIDYFGDPIVKSAEAVELEKGIHTRQGGDIHLFEFLADFSGGEIDIIPDTLMPDMDGDSIEDFFDNCPETWNPGQEDSDLDGIGDACDIAFVCGDATGNGTVDILDISYIIAYLYGSGPPPNPIESADVNSDSAINILDINYLIAFLYQGGPPPYCP